MNNKSVFLILFLNLLLLTISCANAKEEVLVEKTTIPQKEVVTKEFMHLHQSDTILANGLRKDGLRLPNAFQQDYQLTYSKELKVFSYQDTFFVTTLYPGNYEFIQTDPLGDTVLNIDITATSDEETSNILEVIERKDENEVRNTERAHWFFTDHFMLNKKIPNFKAHIFEDGATYEKDFFDILDTSKVSVVFIWEYGCPACKEAIEELNTISKEEANQLFNFYSIFYNDIKIKKGKAQFSNEFKVLTGRKIKHKTTYHDYPLNFGHVLFNASELIDILNYRGYPNAFIIDQNGVVRSFISGYTKDYKEKLLNQVHMVNQLKDVLYDE